MGPVALVCSGCGVRIRTSRPEEWRSRECPRCRNALASAAERPLKPAGGADAGSSPEPGRSLPNATALAVAALGLALLGLGLAALRTSTPADSTRKARKTSPAPIADKNSPCPVLVGVPARPVVARHPVPDSPDRTPVSPVSMDAAPPAPQPEPFFASRRALAAGPIRESSRGMMSPRAAPRAIPGAASASQDAGDRTVMIGDDRGRPLVARVYGGPDSRMVMLPDGRLGWTNALIDAHKPFRPSTIDELRDELLAGPYAGFRVHQTPHYLVFYEGSAPFAKDSGVLLESLYLGLSTSLADKGIEVKEAEFPLVAVIFRTEADFRAHQKIDADIQAYYEILSNHIFFYESVSGDREPPEVTAMRRPQTVAHEGTHQILNNIGVQPRMSHWPLWLVEGLAEYCSPTATKKGVWAGFNKVNPFHMATLHDLKDTLALQGRQARLSHQKIGRDPGRSLVEYLVAREKLSPTDYALAWGLTHYLANRRFDHFVAYLKAMSKMPPLVEQSPEAHLKAFREAFGDDLAGMDRAMHRHLDNLSFEPIPYYAIVFEQPLGQGMTKRGTLVSQSSLVIRQWLDQMQAEHPRPYAWHAEAFKSRKMAFQAVDQWTKGR